MVNPIDSIDVTAIMQEIRELRQRLDDGPQQTNFSQTLPSANIVKEQARTNTNFKEASLPTYGGERATYPAWRRATLTTLGMNWNTFGYSNKIAFLLIYKALEGKAKRQAGAYYESGGKDGIEDPEGFIRFLDQSNWDATRIARARNELSNLKMGNKQKWSSFFSIWSNKLTESQGDNWPDETKITMLKSTLNHTLRLALANYFNIPLDNFFDFIRIVSQIALQHEELAAGPAGNQSRHLNLSKDQSYEEVSTGREVTRSGKELGYVGDEDSSGDTFMGGINMANVARGASGKPLRAKWKTPTQIEALRKEGKCYRCERRGYNTRICKVLPAKNPRTVRPMVNLARLPEIEDGVCDEDDLAENSEN